MSKNVSRIWEELEERENMIKIYCIIFKIKMLKIRFAIFLIIFKCVCHFLDLVIKFVPEIVACPNCDDTQAKLGVLAHAFDLWIWEEEVGRSGVHHPLQRV